MPNQLHKIAVIGSGAWGTALATVLAKNGHSVELWFYDHNAYQQSLDTKINPFLPNADLTGINLSTDLRACLADKKIVILASPCQALPEVLSKIIPDLDPETILVNTAKGLVLPDGLLISEVIEKLAPNFANKTCYLSGPSFASEVADAKITLVTIASRHLPSAQLVQNTFSAPFFRPYASSDIIGVQIGGAIKNVIAIGAGLSDAIDGGMNIKAALLTRGLKEIVKFGIASGANPTTFYGLSGLGDLFLTMNSPLSRNYSFGIALGQGHSVSEVLNIHGVVEGYYTASAVWQKSEQLQVEMPITNALYHILYHTKAPHLAIKELLTRELKVE